MTKVKSELMEGGKKPYKISHRCFYFSREVVLFVRSSKYKSIFSSLFD